MLCAQRLTITLLLLALLANTCLAADPFAAVRTAVRTEQPDPPRAEPAPPPKQPKEPCEDPWNHSCDEDDNDGDGALLGAFVGGTVLLATAPYWGPHALAEGSEPLSAYFASAPYESSPGWMLHGREAQPPLDSYAWGSQIRAEYLDDYDGLTGYRGRLLTEHVSRWGFDGESNYWRQALSPGVHDELWTGDANVVYRFAQNERVQMRSGLGVAWLSDQQQTDLGFNFTYAGDFYPIQPLVISAELDTGWIGEAWMLHLRSTVGVVYKQTEVYSGYDYLEIGNAQIDGFVAGLKFYF